MKIMLILMLNFSFTPVLALEFHSERIKTMDIEVLQQIISRNIRKLESGDEAPEPIIKQSLEILLARPDQGSGSTMIFDQLQNLAKNEENFVSALKSITDDAIQSLNKESKATDDLREQNTYVFILVHMLSEVQRKKDNPQFASVVEIIRDANIDFSDALISHRLLNSMTEIENPSRYANQILPKKRSWWKFW